MSHPQDFTVDAHLVTTLRILQRLLNKFGAFFTSVTPLIASAPQPRGRSLRDQGGRQMTGKTNKQMIVAIAYDGNLTNGNWGQILKHS